jgi:hypothetical protein
MKINIGGKVFDIDDATISKSIEDKTDLTLPGEFVVRDQVEETTFLTNFKTTHERAGAEIAVKDARSKLGLDFEGKTIDNLLKSYEAKVLTDAKIEPEKKVQELTKDIQTLQGTISNLTGEKENLSKEFGSFKRESRVSNIIMSAMPTNIAIPKEDMALIIKSKLSFDTDENDRIVVKNSLGEILKDAQLTPLEPKTVINSFFAENAGYIKNAGGGAGGIDSNGGGGKMTIDKFIEEKAKAGISHTDPKFMDELNDLKKQGLIAE